MLFHQAKVFLKAFVIIFKTISVYCDLIFLLLQYLNEFVSKLKYSCIHCWATFPSLELFNIGSTLPAFIWLSHLYSKIPSLSELVEPTSRFYWSFSSALGRWFRGWRPPKINTTGELGLGRAGGTSLGLPSLCDCCHPLSSIAAL